MTTSTEFYRPTRGEDVGHWNVFPKTGGVIPNVPFNDLPFAVKRMIREALR